MRWFASYGLVAAPQSAAPIAFALIAIPLTGIAANGAQMVLAMMAAQMVFATPLARLGSRFPPTGYLRTLLALRALVFIGIALLTVAGAPFLLFVVAAAAAGSVNGAAYGIQRAILNDLVAPARLARALGIAATVYELTFVLAPLISSATGAISPVLAVWALAVLGAAPIALVPAVSNRAHFETEHGDGRVLTWPIMMWLFCTTAMTCVAAGVEVGAVSLAIAHGLAPELGFLFAGTLCFASACGGIWVSVRNRRPAKGTIIAYHLVCAVGAGLIAFGASLTTTLVGVAMAGLVLAPLSTCYSLALDDLAPPPRRSEVFALMRTANAVSFIVVSALIALTTLTMTLIVSTAFIGTAAVIVIVTVVVGRRRRAAAV